MAPNRIGIVIVHWQGMADTAECLSSLADASASGEDVVVVVNGPGDFDETAARAACPGIDVIRRSDNGGYAAACNAGAHQIFARGMGIALLLNNDLTIPPGALDSVDAIFETYQRAGVVGLPVVYFDDPSRVWSAGGRLQRWLGYTRHIGFQANELPTQSRQVDFTTGAVFAIRRDVFEQLGGLDESYFHYFEDTDFCERARLAGYETWIAAGPAVRHKVSASAGVRGSNRLNRNQAYYFSRNRLRFVRRTFHGPRRMTALSAQPALVLYESAKALFAGNLPEACGRIEGLFAGLRGRTGPNTAAGAKDRA